MNITTLSDLRGLIHALPTGSTADILSSDLEAGNFDTVCLELPDGSVILITYSGPVAQGYVSPFDVGQEEEESF